MSLHPVGHHAVQSPQQLATVELALRLVHALGIIGLPLTFLGLLPLTRLLDGRSGGRGRWPLVALVVYGFSAVAIMIAATLSGFVGPRLIERMAAGGAAAENWRLLLDYTFQVNQGFAGVFTSGSSLAIVLWSWTILRTGALSRILGFYGIAGGVAVPGALWSGNLPLDVHGFGAVVLLQAVWFIAVGIQLLRLAEDGATQAAASTPAARATPTGQPA